MSRLHICAFDLILFLTFYFSLAAMARAPLTFEERVKAQEAIERVYYAHRIWPKENPQPKPPFEETVPKAVIEAKVSDYLRKCVALDKYWQRPIQPEQLQAEMDRMEKGTKDPDTLRELFVALGNDSYLIAECLARQTLADRFLGCDLADSNSDTGAREYPSAEWKSRAFCLGRGESEVVGFAKGPQPPSHSLENCVDPRPNGSISLPGVFPSRTAHTAVWTGTEMIIWGGQSYPYELRSGWRYDPATDTWKATSTGVNCPSARDSHNAVWTGMEMIVWGGSDSRDAYYNTGGRYNPTTDAWVATSTGNGCPSGREYTTAVWTGTEMIIWGGYCYDAHQTLLNTGGLYNPSSDTWRATSIGENCPSIRDLGTAVWTGTEMLVWGGSNCNTGGRYDPGTDRWTPTSTGENCPTGRSVHTAIWTGTEMLVWGGYDGSYCNTGGRYDPATDRWTPTSTGENCPTGRYVHTAIWTGTRMIVWGGWDGNIEVSSGGQYLPATDSWVTTSAGDSCPEARDAHKTIWTGEEMVVWGGYSYDTGRHGFNTGGRYNPKTDTWTATSIPGHPGDCDENGQISIGEVQKAINMFLGTLGPGCGVDCSGDGTVSIGEVQKVINGFLGMAASC